MMLRSLSGVAVFATESKAVFLDYAALRSECLRKVSE
jgi:hypothetical protein